MDQLKKRCLQLSCSPAGVFLALLIIVGSVYAARHPGGFAAVAKIAAACVLCSAGSAIITVAFLAVQVQVHRTGPGQEAPVPDLAEPGPVLPEFVDHGGNTYAITADGVEKVGQAS